MATAKKKPAAKKSLKPTKAVSTEGMRSFRRYPATKPFFVFKITQQPVYWVIICVLVLALAIWVMVLTMKVQDLYNRADAASSEIMSH